MQRFKLHYTLRHTHQSEFHVASIALSRAADKRKSFINIREVGIPPPSALCHPVTQVSYPATCYNIYALAQTSSADPL